MYEQISIFLMSCVIGAVIGLIYDIFKITRIAVKMNRVVVFIQDVVFFIIAAVVSFTFILIGNNGEIRGLLIIGEVLGAVIYFLTISIVIIKSARFIIYVVGGIISFMYKITFKPFVTLFRFLISKVNVIIMKRKLATLLKEENLDE